MNLVKNGWPHQWRDQQCADHQQCATTNSGNYTVIVTNIAGSVTSSNAVLTVQSSPVITVQPTPTNQSMAVGATATFTVTAIGTVPLSYQWRVNGTNLVNDRMAAISGATTNVLIISNAQTTNSGNYTVIVTNVRRIGDQFQCAS